MLTNYIYNEKLYTLELKHNGKDFNKDFITITSGEKSIDIKVFESKECVIKVNKKSSPNFSVRSGKKIPFPLHRQAILQLTE